MPVRGFDEIVALVREAEYLLSDPFDPHDGGGPSLVGAEFRSRDVLTSLPFFEGPLDL